MTTYRFTPRLGFSPYDPPAAMRWRRRVLGCCLFFAVVDILCAVGAAHGQISTAPVEGLRENEPRVHALINARLVVAPGHVIDSGCLVLRDGVIDEVGAGVKPPPDARVWDLRGGTVYAGFIDSYSHYGLGIKDRPKPLRPEKPGTGEHPKAESEAGGPEGTGSWNPLVTPQRTASKLISANGKDAETLRALGFTSAVVVPGRGIFRGESALVNLSGLDDNRSLLRTSVAQNIAFELSDTAGRQQYPVSLMGCIALIRQTFLDTGWYQQARAFAASHPTAGDRPEANAALGALAAAAEGREPVVFEAEDELDLLRALRLADEFKLNAILRGSGREYRMIEPLKKAGVPIIVTLDFPDAPTVETPENALDVTLEALEHWSEAPANAERLAKAGIPFVLSTDGLDDPKKKFWPRLRRAVKRGLAESDALASLTTVPAKLFGMDARLGTLEKGRSANLIVASGDLFADDHAEVLSAWIDGLPYPTEAARLLDARGTYALTYPDATGKGPDTLQIGGDAASKLKASAGGAAVDARTEGETLVVLAPGKLFGAGEGTVRLSAPALTGGGEHAVIEGTGQLPNGEFFRWSAKKTASYSPPPGGNQPPGKSASEPAAAVDLPAAYPAGAFGRRFDELEGSGIVLVQNAAIWTSGPQGKLENASLLVENGKIKAVGDNILAPAGARIIDAAGQHVTPGLVDAHSHTAISRGVNEATHAVTCEVRIGDVLDATDISIYRELAGGLTVANILHGSANPIGGQCQPIKLRWGGLPEDLKIAGAMPGVKFALGENVKQSNWGDKFTTRYPQTRMGVEEIMRDTFLAARDYERAWDDYHKKPAGTAMPSRRILRLEAVVEMLNKQRFIHIHSYRQDEISMFARLAREMGLTVAAFHHGLECYKVADEVAAIGAGVSTFSDWWAYKQEAMDAIPDNGAMLQQAGVLTSFNSDSNELARRLNTEAAKAVKYGGLSEEEALKFVTINPARQLRLDAQLGSLEVGKDADFVIWNGPPLSTYTRAEQTWIDGKCYFDYQRDLQMRQEVTVLREKLVQSALNERLKDLQTPSATGDEGKKEGGPTAGSPSEFERLLMHRAIHHALEQQGLYHGGFDRHNCSNAGGY